MELENKELRERLKLLEKQIENASRLITIENQSLAATQQQAAERQRKEELPAEPVKPEAVKDSERTGTPLPSLHSPFWAPDLEPSLKTGITAMTAAVLELMGKE